MNITKWGMVEEEIHYHDLVDLNVFGFNPLKCYYDWSFTFSFILFFFHSWRLEVRNTYHAKF